VTDDTLVSVEGGRELAAGIPNARLAEFPGTDHLAFLHADDRILAEIEEFSTGLRSTPVVDRVLATVVFTDIVDSTVRAGAKGDLAWRDLLNAHDKTVRQELSRFRGREVKSLGDGFLATFDGPPRAIHCARAIRDSLHRLALPVRIGVHTGEVELAEDDVRGIAVHIASRVAHIGGADDVLVSRTVKDLVAGSGIKFDDFGTCKMDESSKSLRQSSLFMKIAGWGIIALPLLLLEYPPGFLRGMNPPVFPFICWQHPPSTYDGVHPIRESTYKVVWRRGHEIGAEFVRVVRSGFALQD
jgi:class 3 adenylate cyclase